MNQFANKLGGYTNFEKLRGNLVPDFLLTDHLAESQPGPVWWYRGKEQSHSKRLRGKAGELFRLICKHAREAKWDGYTPAQMSMVAVATNHIERPFWSQSYFEDWLKSASPRFQDWFKEEIEYLKRKVSSEEKVLDVGCGFGRHIEELAPKCEEIVGIDNTSEMVSRATQELLRKHDNVHVYLAPADNMPFSDERFDRIICMTNTFGNMKPEDYRRKVLHEFHRVLKPEGEVIISVYADLPGVLEQREKDYRNVGLTIDEIRQGTIYTAEGLSSKQFSERELERLFRDCDFDGLITKIDEISYICNLTKKER